MKDYLIIMPAHNEAANIGAVLNDMIPYREHTLVIDDGCTDDTKQIAEEYGFNCLSNLENLGVANSVIKGMDYALEQNFKKAIIMDADGQHNPAYIPQFLKELEEHDFVFGCRYHKDELIPTNKWASNLFAAALYAELTGQFLTDISCGFKGMHISGGLLEAIKESQGFGIVYDIVSYALCMKKDISIVQIDAVYYYDELLCTRNSEIMALLNSVENCRKVFGKNPMDRFGYAIRNMKQAVQCNQSFGINVAATNFWAFPITNGNYLFQMEPKDIRKWIEKCS